MEYIKEKVKELFPNSSIIINEYRIKVDDFYLSELKIM